MNRRHRLNWLILLMMLMPIVLSCTEMKHWASSKNLLEERPPAEQDIRLAEKHRLAGEYQKALDIYAVSWRKHPQDNVLADAYVKSLDQMVSTADRALTRMDFAGAGRTYDILLKNMDHFKRLDRELSFDHTELGQKLDDCKKALFKGGFQEYRAGNLDAAIILWQGLLAIDPDNTEIKEALRTAKLQQKTLREQQ